MFGRLRRFASTYDIWIILSLAFILRMLGFRFTGDVLFPEFYRDYYSVSNIVRNLRFPLYGPPSILGGFHFGPFYYYYLAPFLWLFRLRPDGLVFASVITSLGAIYGLYKLMDLWFDNHGVAQLSSIFCAFSIYSIRLSNYVSNPNLLPAFVIWFCYCLTRFVDGDERLATCVAMGVSFSFAFQLHVTAMVVLPLVLVSTLLFTRRVPNARSITAFGVSFLLATGPYIYYEVITRFIEVQRLLHLGTTQLGKSPDILNNISSLFRFVEAALISNVNWEYPYTYLQPNSLYIVLAFGAGILGGFVIRRICTGQVDFNIRWPIRLRPTGQVILLSWGMSAVVTLLLYKRFVRYYYLIILWPIPMIALAVAVLWMRTRFKIYYVAIGFWLLMSLLQLYSYEGQRVGTWNDFASGYAAQLRLGNIAEVGSPGIAAH